MFSTRINWCNKEVIRINSYREIIRVSITGRLLMERYWNEDLIQWIGIKYSSDLWENNKIQSKSRMPINSILRSATFCPDTKFHSMVSHWKSDWSQDIFCWPSNISILLVRWMNRKPQTWFSIIQKSLFLWNLNILGTTC